MEDWGEVCLSTLKGLVPAAVRLGLVTENEAQACVAEIADLAKTKHQVVFAPGLMVSAWRRKPILSFGVQLLTH